MDVGAYAYDECTENVTKRDQKAKKLSHLADKKCNERENLGFKRSPKIKIYVQSGTMFFSPCEPTSYGKY